ncbi:MAG: MBL fold metallo-hydrolase [Patescibacteria group bacterium]
MSGNFSLTCWGGVGEVTGSNFLLKTPAGEFLVDCGLLQGSRFSEEANSKDFPYTVSSIKSLFVTHAHLDHIGRIPKLVRAGFSGAIYSTPETMELAPIMFADALAVMRHDLSPSAVLYDEKDIEKTISLWKPIQYKERLDLGEGVSVVLKNAGHILGSSMAEFSSGDIRFLATGDLGNSPSILLPDTESPVGATHLLMESVYGDRNHPPREERDKQFADALRNTIAGGGVAVIPAFSLERTQDILFTLNNLIESAQIPSVPVYLDSPLAIRVTGIFRRHSHDYKTKVMSQIAGGDDIFNFPKLKISESSHDSAHIQSRPSPKIILAGSGMSAGGRVTRHEVDYLPDSKNSIILVGYQSIGTVGRHLEEGLEEVKINGQAVPVRARIYSIRGFSAHKDLDHLVEFAGQAVPTLKKVFVAMGEPKSSMFLAQRLRDYLGLDATLPERGKEYDLI